MRLCISGSAAPEGNVASRGRSRKRAGTYQGNNTAMTIGARLRRLREEKKLSQEDLGERTGLVPCYISRVENGHTVPSLENLERLAAALEVPLYALFYEGNEPSTPPRLDIDWSELQTTEERFFERVRRLTSRDWWNRRDPPGPPIGLCPAHGAAQVHVWVRARREGRKREKQQPQRRLP